MSDIPPDVITVRVKRYAAGKAFGFARGDPAFEAQALKALQRSLVIEASVDRTRFVTMMREQGVPEAVIDGYLERISVEDEAWLQDVYPN
jgi:hypothetical protein